MFVRRPEYIAVAVIGGVIAVAASVVTVFSLDSGISEPGRKSQKKAEDIVVRAGELTSSSEEEIKIAESRVKDGFISCGDYVISVMTSPEYLLSGVSDEKFASDLCTVIYGENRQDEVSSILNDLQSNSRVVTIDKALSSEDAELGASEKPAGKGSVISSVSLESAIDSAEQYTVGIREAMGSYSATGDEVRTDFFVDGSLYYGYMRFNNANGNDGYKEFILSWDTADVLPGRHEVYALLRSSDGRGTVISGGEITIPEKTQIVPGGVTYGVLPGGEATSWYMMDCGDGDCYIDFAGLTDDIRVSLYDLKGNFVGANENPGIPYAMLRGPKQDANAVAEETGITGVSNCYYVCVSRTGSGNDIEKEISYALIQSRECAYFEGEYMAVTEDDGSGKVKLTDSTMTTYQVDRKSAGILPINGALSSLAVFDAATNNTVGIYPEFEYVTRDYSFFTANNKSIAVRCTALEGFTASVTIEADSNGNKTTLEQGQIYELPRGETEITCTVKGFGDDPNTYKFFFLNGDDEGDFMENTLSKFPESYYSGLWLVHKLKPNYVFTPYYTNVQFSKALAAEDSKARSLIQNSVNPTYVKPNSKVYDKPDWMLAKTEVVSYYLDPRNFFTPEKIFTFEMLGFDPEVHTVAGVKTIIKGSFMDTDSFDYATAIYEAGEKAGVSPYFLASRIIQEMGFSGESALCRGDLTGYEGYYNFYNIGAYATTEPGGAVINGARYAQWGKDPDAQEITDAEAEFLLPWTSPERAITGGALWIASGYINAGQNTLYFQKFDVLDDGKNRYEHQYAQNIQMAYSEGMRYYRSYDSIGMTDAGFEFIIPVYNDMPESYGSLPS